MKKKRFLVFFILTLVLVAGLTACERSVRCANRNRCCFEWASHI